jgi:HTH-type transcriptional regulator/antitoxin HigA
MKLLTKHQQTKYLELIEELPLVSITTDEHLNVAQQLVDHLMDQAKLDRGEQAYLDALCDLIAVYEDQHHSIPVASDADLLRHLMDAKGITQAQLHKDTGLAKSGICEVLAGHKSFSKAMMITLADYFHVPPAVFVANLAAK